MLKMGKAIFMVSLTIASGALHYCFSQMLVSVESPCIEWLANSDITPSMGAEGWQIPLKLVANATTIYTNALKFMLLPNSIGDSMKLEIASVNDTDHIIWGIRFYIYKSGASNSTLKLVDRSSVMIDGTNGNCAVCEVGYRQRGADVDYGSTTTPVYSTSFTGVNSTAYMIVIEAHASGILSMQTATMQLRLSWSQ